MTTMTTAPVLTRNDDGTLTGPTTADEWLDAMWWGDALGWSEHQLAHDLATYRRTLAGLDAGTVRPQDVVGRGYKSPKDVARRWLRERIAATTEALATRGRSHAINRSNAKAFARDGKGTATRYLCFCTSWEHDVAPAPERETAYRDRTGAESLAAMDPFASHTAPKA